MYILNWLSPAILLRLMAQHILAIMWSVLKICCNFQLGSHHAFSTSALPPLQLATLLMVCCQLDMESSTVHACPLLSIRIYECYKLGGSCYCNTKLLETRELRPMIKNSECSGCTLEHAAVLLSLEEGMHSRLLGRVVCKWLIVSLLATSLSSPLQTAA